MLTKQEIYDSLKNDGAKLRAINFTTKDELVEMYRDRFGIDPYEQPNTEKLSDGDDFEEKPIDKEEKIPLLKFSESGWCSDLNRPYVRGLYRPANHEEYLALKKYASEEMFV